MKYIVSNIVQGIVRYIPEPYRDIMELLYWFEYSVTLM